VVDVDIDSRRVMVGSPERLDVIGIEAIKPTWANLPLSVEPVAVMAQVRAHATPVPAMAHFDGARIHVELLQTIRGLANGQAVVLYDGERVIGSGTVDRTHKQP
jgi:tRNA-specific 2-thiouridylase